MELLRRGRGKWIGKIKIPKRSRKWNFQLAELSSLSEQDSEKVGWILKNRFLYLKYFKKNIIILSKILDR
jgi:hypothetical protein